MCVFCCFFLKVYIAHAAEFKGFKIPLHWTATVTGCLDFQNIVSLIVLLLFFFSPGTGELSHSVTTHQSVPSLGVVSWLDLAMQSDRYHVCKLQLSKLTYTNTKDSLCQPPMLNVFRIPVNNIAMVLQKLTGSNMYMSTRLTEVHSRKIVTNKEVRIETMILTDKYISTTTVHYLVNTA